jgi:hypothetical protein
MRVVSRRQATPKIVNDYPKPKIAVAKTKTKAKEPLWKAKEKQGVKFCSDMVRSFIN